MPTPHRLTDTALERLDEAALVAHLVACRDAGRGDEATAAAWTFPARDDDILARLELRLPDGIEAEDDVAVVIEKAVRAPFDGVAAKQLHTLLDGTAHRVVAGRDAVDRLFLDG